MTGTQLQFSVPDHNLKVVCSCRSFESWRTCAHGALFAQLPLSSVIKQEDLNAQLIMLVQNFMLKRGTGSQIMTFILLPCKASVFCSGKSE